MADDIKAIDSGVNIHNGYAVVGLGTINYYKSFPANSGVAVPTMIRPAIAGIKGKYDTKWDDKGFYAVTGYQ